MNQRSLRKRLILALDVKDIRQARRFMNMLASAIGMVKIGPVLFTAYGPKIVDLVREKGSRVFLDLKFHDIPNTVAGAVRQATRLNVAMVSLHTAGGEEMLVRAAQAAKEEAAAAKVKKPLLLGITVLTSDKAGADTRRTVVQRARLARKAGLDGVVCSVHEAAAVRKACGKAFVIVTPGIRPQGADTGDQKRVATAATAFAAGAQYIVVGRPILEAANPLEAVKRLMK
ncbi:MAG TPA: orotidine-5'-phosphate decarboxylase [Candidatus Omnitrophota bacterium]|nr:orotidine-5'-phosphate decarboxylase [Candidatus Omnitrophota bacterium]